MQNNFRKSRNHKRPLQIAILLICAVVSVAQAQVIIPAPPQLSARAYLLMDADTGKVIVEHESETPHPPASLTKMMTSYIVSEEIERGRLKETDLVRISANAWRKGGAASGSSTMFLEPKTEVSVINLLRGVIIQSGNDASIALAEHIAGSETAFADVMNQQAKLLGMNNSNFVNATGWPAENHISTARDLGILARALVADHPEHYAIYSEKYFKYNGINQANRNKLLFSNRYVDGIKTGHTEEAGYGLVASSEREGMRLISVVIGTKSEKVRADESQRLLAYGFRYFKTLSLYQSGDKVNTVRVWQGLDTTVDVETGESVVATLPRGAKDKIKALANINRPIKAPIKKGQVLGNLEVKFEDQVLAKVNLVAAKDVASAGFFSRMWDSVLLMIDDGANVAKEGSTSAE